MNRKLNDPLTSSITYWSIMKTFFNGKKVPAISPLLWVCHWFSVKSKYFQFFFAKQCTLVSNNSVLPSEFTYMTEERIQSITFGESVVIKIIRALDVDKTHGHDDISVRMRKLSTNSVPHLLTLIFQNSMAAGTFATQWNRSNIVPINKKNDKQIVSDYPPDYFLLICRNFWKANFQLTFQIFWGQ